ncbi:MAG: aspartate 1-decarboxylase [Planctomycetes bacterium]|nr:aspartate 1-decarboxylase [Planctomycetota bacterium]
MRIFLRSKLHKATVTEANLAYVGSVTIDRDLMDAADIQEFEKVLIVDNTNGARLETYAIPGERGSGVICINGAAAHLVKKGDEVIIMTFEVTHTPHPPVVVLLDAANRIARRLTDPVREEGVSEENLYS